MCADIARDDLPSCRLATTASITLTGLQTIDGILTKNGDRCLVKDQAAPAQNGVYSVNSAGAWKRTTDAATVAQVTSGLNVYVSEGTANGGKTFTLTTPDPIKVGTTELTFEDVGGTGFSSPAGTDLDMNTFQIHNLADPTDPQDAATRAYVDANGFDAAANYNPTGDWQFDGAIQLTGDGGLIEIGQSGSVQFYGNAGFDSANGSGTIEWQNFTFYDTGAFNGDVTFNDCDIKLEDGAALRIHDTNYMGQTVIISVGEDDVYGQGAFVIDGLVAGNTLFLDGGAGFLTQGASSSRMLQVAQNGDNDTTWHVLGDGMHIFGDGAGNNDTNLYRESADTLATDDSFHIAGDLTVDGSFPGGGWAGTATSDLDMDGFAILGVDALTIQGKTFSKPGGWLTLDGLLEAQSFLATDDTGGYYAGATSGAADIFASSLVADGGAGSGQNRFVISAEGGLQWSQGTPNVFASTLKPTSPGAMQMVGDLNITGDLTVDGAYPSGGLDGSAPETITGEWAFFSGSQDTVFGDPGENNARIRANTGSATFSFFTGISNSIIRLANSGASNGKVEIESSGTTSMLIGEGFTSDVQAGYTHVFSVDGTPVASVFGNRLVTIGLDNSGDASLGDSPSDNLAFFGGAGSTQVAAIAAPTAQSAIYVQADVQDICDRVNDIRSLLANYGLMA